ncbi:MAG: tRNA (adenine(22)-N(1))-methyltransferase TrmK [Mycoplasmatota bacterium]
MISYRLKEIASLVSTHSVYDVGCDHGLLSIYLSENHMCTAIDITDKCIEKTRQNCEKFKCNMEVIKNDGLKDIDIRKNSTVLILGLGTRSILDITNDYNKDIDSYIIQTNNDLYTLRKTLTKNYFIEEEKVIKDKNKIYVVIKFSKGFVKYKRKDYILGPLLKNNKESIIYYDNYLKKLMRQYKNTKKLIVKIKLKYLIYIIKKQRKSLLSQ